MLLLCAPANFLDSLHCSWCSLTVGSVCDDQATDGAKGAAVANPCALNSPKWRFVMIIVPRANHSSKQPRLDIVFAWLSGGRLVAGWWLANGGTAPPFDVVANGRRTHATDSAGNLVQVVHIHWTSSCDRATHSNL